MDNLLLRSFIERPENHVLASSGLWEPASMELGCLSRRGVLFGGVASAVGVGLLGGCGSVAIIGPEAAAASGVAAEIFKRALVDFIATFLTKAAAKVIEQATVFLVGDNNSLSPFGVDKKIPCTRSHLNVSVEVNVRARADHRESIPSIKDLNTRELSRCTYEVKKGGAIVTPCGSRVAADQNDKAAFSSLCKDKYKTDPSKLTLEYMRPAHVKSSASDEGKIVSSYGVAYRDDPTSGDLLIGMA
jgi:hypothetical protein